QKSDVSVEAFVDHAPDFFREGFRRAVTFYTSENYLLRENKPVKLDIPDDAIFGLFRDWLTLTLRSDWNVGGATHKAGSLLAVKLDSFLNGGRKFDTLFEPQPRVSLQGVATLKNAIVLELSENVHTRVVETAPGATGWTTREMKLPGRGTANVRAVDPDVSDEIWIDYADFLTPDSLYMTRVGSDPAQPIKSRPGYFETAGMDVQQFEASSRDGTKIPYFVVGKADALRSGT